jgi:putative ABC transport system substrate-binding protein
VDLIVTSGTPATLALKQATTTIPVVVAIIGDPSDGIVVLDDPMLLSHGRALALLAMKHRLPLIGNQRLAEAGALLGYGTDAIAAFRQSAALIDKILKGAKPADIPIQQAERVVSSSP